MRLGHFVQGVTQLGRKNRSWWPERRDSFLSMRLMHGCSDH